MKHFRHIDRLSGEDEYYLTTLESILEFIHGISPQDLKITEEEYNKLYKQSTDQIDNLAKQKEEAAQIELTDLLEIGNSS